MPTSSPDEIRDAFLSVCQQFEKSFNQGEAEGLTSLYTEDAKILPPNMDIVEGRSAIQAYWQGALDMGIKSFKGEMIDADFSGNLGYLVGKYILYDSDNQEIDQGRWISVLNNIDGKWKVHRDIFQRSTPLEEQ
jgi:ketosteroid isomerase-like protein